MLANGGGVTEKDDVKPKRGVYKERSVKYSMLMNVLLSTSSMLFGFITLPIASRTLQVEAYGQVSFAQSVSMWFSTFAMLGISTYGLRECAKRRDDVYRLTKLVRELLLILTVTTSLAAVCYIACIFVVPQFKSVSALLWIFLPSLVLTSYGAEWFFQAIEEYDYITFRNLAFKVVSLLAIVLLIKSPSDYLVYGAIVAFSSCGSNVMNLIRINRLVPLKTKTDLNLKKHVKPLLVFAWAFLAISMYTTFDSVLLGLLSDSRQVGLYQMACKLKGVAVMAVGAAGNATIPRLTYYHSKGDSKSYITLLEKNFKLVLLFCLGAMSIFWLYGDQIIMLISGESYLGAVTALRISGIVVLFISLSNISMNMIMVPKGEERMVGVTGAVAAISSVALNILLDRRFGATGAALALLFAEGSVVVVGFWVCRRDLMCLDLAGIMKSFGFGFVIATTCAAISGEIITSGSPIIKLMMGVVVYGGVLLFWLLFTKESLTVSIIDKLRGLFAGKLRRSE